VARHRGRLNIVDGHHRLAAMKLRGKTHARVRFVDLDES
jgi:ParB-like chromosome segregation protein Spo0J